MGWLGRGIAVARAPGNALGFAVRRRVARSRGTPRLRAESMGGLFDYLEGQERAVAQAHEVELCRRFDLDAVRERSCRRDYREIVDTLTAFDRISSHLPRAPELRVVDVGSRNWSYVDALERWFARNCDDLELVGVEIDGHYVGPDGYSRCDHAQVYAARTGNPGVRYEVADFRQWPGAEFDVVTMLFPFLMRYPLLAWGLPWYLFDPDAMIDRAVDALRLGGVLVAMHQTAAERDRMLQHADRLRGRVELLDCRRHATRLVAHWPKTQDRHFVVLRRFR